MEQQKPQLRQQQQQQQQQQRYCYIFMSLNDRLPEIGSLVSIIRP
jgi:hypothetical protein